jgi:hypothetical protein
MKTTLGGERLGSGNKQEVILKNYGRSTHDLSYTFRSSMSAGTLVPFMSQLALPGDTFDMDLECDIKTLPTIGPLFGSYKVQLDVFEVPVRLYQGKLHMNMINIGMDMSQIKLPQFKLLAKYDKNNLAEDAQVNPSSIYSYLNVRGLGRTKNGLNADIEREFNAVPLLGYWNIYKNYYANLQESDKGKAVGYVVHQESTDNTFKIVEARALLNGVYAGGNQGGNILNDAGTVNPFTGNFSIEVELEWLHDYPEYGAPNLGDVYVKFNGTQTLLSSLFNTFSLEDIAGTDKKLLKATTWTGIGGTFTFEVTQVSVDNTQSPYEGIPQLTRFNLENIDKMRQDILQEVASPNAVIVDHETDAPYGLGLDTLDGNYENAYCRSAQEGLGIKCYQSDLHNNWLDTEWITGEGGIADVSAVLVESVGDEQVVKMDALNLSQKVYNMLNRIAVSGGSYDDWLDAVYTHDRAKAVDSPVYHGSLIKELAFQEVIAQGDSQLEGNSQPLGTLAGRGRLTGKHKGGKIRIKTNEPAYLIGIVSLTPRLDYSQGNSFDMNLKNMNDFHKPELSQIAFEDKITDTMAWFDTKIDTNNNNAVEYESAGKQPAWINYMSAVNACRGNFAMAEKEMFMTLNRRYEQGTNGIEDLSTYVDPSKFNHIFAETSVSSQNFWVQIGVKNIARRKMSAKLIPNL